MSSQTKSLISTLAVAFLDNFGYSIVFILFAPLILSPEYGFFSSSVSEGSKNILLGVLTGVFPFFLFFGAPFWGDVGDLWGRKKALVWTILGTIVGHILTAVAILFESYIFLLFARALAGFLSGNVSICLAIISDISPDPKTKGRNFGLLTVFLGIGWILSMLVGGYLSDPNLGSFFNPALPFYIAAGLTFLGYLAVQVLLTETHRAHAHLKFDLIKSIRDIGIALQTKQMRPFLYVLLFWSLGWFFTFQWFTPVSIESFHVTQETVSSHLIALGICWIIGGVILNPIFLKKTNSYKLSIYSILCLAVGVFLCSLSSQYWLFSLFFALSALAAPISLSNILNEVAISSPAEIQGKAMGFSQSFQALAGIIVPFAGGAIANLSIDAIYPLSAFLILFSCLLLFRSKKVNLT
jgi:DHA1 family tetracycline resistance protein-like MFS transporter